MKNVWHKRYNWRWIYLTELSENSLEWALYLDFYKGYIDADGSLLGLGQGHVHRVILTEVFQNPYKPTREELVLLSLERPYLEPVVKNYKSFVKEYLEWATKNV